MQFYKMVVDIVTTDKTFKSYDIGDWKMPPEDKIKYISYTPVLLFIPFLIMLSSICSIGIAFLLWTLSPTSIDGITLLILITVAISSILLYTGIGCVRDFNIYTSLADTLNESIKIIENKYNEVPPPVFKIIHKQAYMTKIQIGSNTITVEYHMDGRINEGAFVTQVFFLYETQYRNRELLLLQVLRDNLDV